MPIFRVKSVKIYTGQKNLHWRRQWRQWQLSGMFCGWAQGDTEVILFDLRVSSVIWQYNTPFTSSFAGNFTRSAQTGDSKIISKGNVLPGDKEAVDHRARKPLLKEEEKWLCSLRSSAASSCCMLWFIWGFPSPFKCCKTGRSAFVECGLWSVGWCKVGSQFDIF